LRLQLIYISRGNTVDKLREAEDKLMEQIQELFKKIDCFGDDGKGE